MNVSPGTLVPPALVLAVAGWSCWSIFGATTAPAPAAKPKPAEGVAKLLEPEFGKSAERDPFALPGEAEAEARGAKVTTSGKPAETPESEGRKLMAGAVARLAAKIAEERAAEVKRAAARERLAHLPLSATSVHADRRVALIGGRAYVEGETIDGTDPAIGPVILAEVRPREVTVRSSAGPVLVKFSESSPSGRAASALAPAPAAQAAKKAKKPRQATGVVTLKGKKR